MLFGIALGTIVDDQTIHLKQQTDTNQLHADTFKVLFILIKKKKTNIIRSADTTVIVGSDPGMPSEASS